MKWALVAMMAMLTGCASSGKLQTVPSSEEPATNPVVHVFGRYLNGQACAISPWIALTAAHMVDMRPLDASVPLSPLQWSDDEGYSGVLVPLFVNKSRDLAVTRSNFMLPEYALPAKEAPRPGDMLRVVGYDYRSKSKAFARMVLEARVIRVVAGHIIMDTKASHGSSGSCLLDTNGYLVGIMTGGNEVYGGIVGRGVGVWGSWFPTINLEEKTNEE